MTLASKMTQLTEELETAQDARRASVDATLGTVALQLASGQAALQRMASAEFSTRNAELKGIFSEAAITRGRADDLIGEYGDQRRVMAAELRAKLENDVADLQRSVETLLNEYSGTREVTAAQDAAARASYIKDLRARVNALLADAEKFLGALSKDRKRAARIWHQHARKARKPRSETVRPAGGAEKASAGKKSRKATAKASQKK